MALRKTGLEFQLKNYAQFQRGVQTANRLAQNLQNTFQQVAKTPYKLKTTQLNQLVPPQLQNRILNLRKQLGALNGTVAALPGPVSGALNSLLSLGNAMGGALGKVNLLVAGAVALTTALVGLGLRGAAMPGVIEAFDIATARAGIYSQVLLQDLRTASRGTIADFALMKTANLALAGAGDELGKALGPGRGLAGLMEIARAQARATGQSVDYLFDSLVTGVKRSTPLLIDNTGLVLKVSQADEAYARSIGKAVDQLTAEEKQIALLNATLEAGKFAVDSYGQGALQASERIARLRTTITNALDKLAVAVQPIFNFVLAIGEAILTFVLSPLKLITPLIYELSNAISGTLTTAFETFTSLVSDVFAPVARLIQRWFYVLVGLIRGFGLAWNWLLGTIAKAVRPIATILKKYVTGPLSKALDPTTFAKAGGLVIGALAEGFLWAANTYLFPAVVAIATFVADFLMGFSPPKRGPLSTIDQGGANLALAWLEGFTGISLAPVEDMMGRVDAELGTIGQLTNDQVKRRLARLDEVLQPFIDHLEIAKAKMAAIVEPIKRVQDALDKKLGRALERFTKGELDAEAVRAIDRQKAAVQERLTMFEDMTAEAELQLAMAESQQALERALLEVQARRTAQAEQAADATEEARQASEAAEKAAKGSGDAAIPDAAGGAFDLPGGDPIADWLGTGDAVDDFWGEMRDSFLEGFTMTGADEQLARAGEWVDLLKAQGDRVKSSKPFQAVTDAIDTVFGSGPDSVIGKIRTFKTDHLEPLWNDVTSLFDNFSLDKLIGTVTDTFSYPNGTLWTSLDSFQSAWENFWAYPDGTLWTALADFSLEDLWNKFKEFFGAAGEQAGKLWDSVKNFGDNVKTFFTDTLPGYFDDFSLQGLLDKVTGAIGGGLDAAGDAVGDAVDTLGDTGGTLYDILKRVGDFVLTLVVAPFEGLAQAIADALNLSDLAGTLKTHITDKVQGVRDSIQGFFTDPAGSIKATVQNLVVALPNWASGLAGSLWTALTEKFYNVKSRIYDYVEGPVGSIKTIVQAVVSGVTTWLFGLWDNLKSSLSDKFSDAVALAITWLVGEPDEGQSLWQLLTALPGKIVSWLTDLPNKLVDALETPFINSITFIIEKFGELKEAILAVLGLVPGNPFGSAEGSSAVAGGIEPVVITEEDDVVLYGQYGMEVDPRTGLEVPRQRAKGGVGRGWNIVGDAGPELVNFGSPSRVLSFQDTLRAIFGKIAPLSMSQYAYPRTPAAGPVYNTNTSTSFTANFNYRNNRQALRMQLAELRAMA